MAERDVASEDSWSNSDGTADDSLDGNPDSRTPRHSQLPIVSPSDKSERYFATMNRSSRRHVMPEEASAGRTLSYLSPENPLSAADDDQRRDSSAGSLTEDTVDLCARGDAVPAAGGQSEAYDEDEDEDAEGTLSDPSQQDILDHGSERRRRSREPRSHHLDASHASMLGRPGDPNLWPLMEELMSLESELTKEAKRLYERKQRLKKREQRAAELERLACQSHDRLAQCAELEVTQRWSKLEEERRAHTHNLMELVRRRDKEVQRLEASFSTMREANHELKEKVSKLETESIAFSKQLSSSQRRVRNLQARCRLQDQHQNSAEVVREAMARSKRVQDAGHAQSSSSGRSAASTVQSSSQQDGRYIIPFCTLLEWIVDAQLMSSWKKVQHGPTKMKPDEFQAQCAKLLPLVVELLTTCDVSTMANQIAIPCLRFALVSSRFITHSSVSAAVQSQRASLLMMFRHLGEAMTRPKGSNQPAMLASASWHVQLLSSLFVLANVNRTDLVLHAFDVLRNSLRNAVQKSIFLNHSGMGVIVMFMRSSTAPSLVSAAVDVHLHLVNEPAIVDRFLQACCNEEWFHSVSCLLRDHKNFVLAEKLSIVLQKLATARIAQQHFVAHQLVPIAEQLMQRCGPDKAFLLLNLRSLVSQVTGTVKEAAKRARS
ncbi:coiled-coil domain-containing protein 138-like [Sycon ciliatum]|uniref:coiled-coil domain-containing protein 138-like n=1 Tax=Sycon ciliatum TaxID=27933 RepID=UPI0031F66A1C